MRKTTIRDSKMEEIQMLILNINTLTILQININKEDNRDFEEEIEDNERTKNLSL